VVFGSSLHDVLYGINEIGEFVNFPHDFVIKTQEKNLKGQYRFWYKLTIYGEWKNIFQSNAMSMFVLVLIMLIRLIVWLISINRTNITPDSAFSEKTKSSFNRDRLPSEAGGGEHHPSKKSTFSPMRIKKKSKFGYFEKNKMEIQKPQRVRKNKRNEKTIIESEYGKSSKEYYNKLNKLQKVDHFLVYLYQFIIEMSLVDLLFSCTFNI
jgi:hypothetical protein